jgi:hypothetical protein
MWYASSMDDPLFLVLALGLPFALTAPFGLRWALKAQAEATMFPAYVLRGFDEAMKRKRIIRPGSDTAEPDRCPARQESRGS